MRRQLRASLGRLALAGSVLALGACTDWADDLYARTMGEEAAPRSDQPVPGQDGPYPNLAEVPSAPVNVSTPEQIDAVAEALAADLANVGYSGTLQRADDETTPAPMLAAPPEVVVREEEVTVIAPGGEIEIAEAAGLPSPPSPAAEEEVVVLETGVAVEEAIEPASPPAEQEVAVVVEREVVLVDPAPRAEPREAAIAEPAISRVETDTVRSASGELVGTVTRVVASREVVVVRDPSAPVEEVVAVETAAVEPDAVTRVEEAVVSPPELVVTDNIVVVPDYVIEQEIAVVEPEPVFAEPGPAAIEAMTEAEAELQAAVAAEALAMDPVPDPVVTARVEPAVVVEEIVVDVGGDGGRVTGAAAPEALDFDDLLAASGPDAVLGGEPVAALDVPVSGGEAAFTSGGALPEALAAIIRFGDGSSALGAAERDILRQVAAIHGQRGGAIRLVGHASRTASGMETSGQQLANFNISLDRATAVAEELIRLGVPREAVIVEAAGDRQATSLDQAGDRRVDVFIGA